MSQNISTDDMDDFSSEFSLLQDVDIPVVGNSGEVDILSANQDAGSLQASSVFPQSFLNSSQQSSQKTPSMKKSSQKILQKPVIKETTSESFKKINAPMKKGLVNSDLDSQSVQRSLKSSTDLADLNKKHGVSQSPVFSQKKEDLQKVEEKKPEVQEKQLKTIERPVFAESSQSQNESAKEEGVNLDEYVRSQVAAYIDAARGIDEQEKSIQSTIKDRQKDAQQKRELSSQKLVQSKSPILKKEEPISQEREVDRVESILRNVVQQHELSFEDSVSESRFFALARSRFRDIRDKFELADAFVRPTKIGGLGMESAKANILASVIDAEALSYLGLDKVSTKSAQKKVTKVNEKKEEKALSQQQKYKDAILHKISTLQKQSSKPQQPPRQRSLPEKQISTPKIQKLKKKMPASVPQVVRPRVIPKGPSLDGVNAPKTHRSQVMSPLDELQKMNLQNFRQLGVNADIRVQKIREKLDVLEQDSFALRTQGIDAWKVSDVNRMYIQIGNDSISQGKSISQIISEKEGNGERVLSAEEFNAIADLNASLRY